MFGRIFKADERDRGFLMSAHLEPRLELPARKSWRINPRALDQGRTGTCVGHGWRNWMRCAPLRTERTGPSAFDIYRSAVARDGMPENDDEAALPDGDPGLDYGTTVRAGAKAVLDMHRMASYVWAWDLQTALRWLLLRGPLVIGVNWYSSMMDTVDGMIRIAPGASVEGGHCVCIRSADTRRALVGGPNSWGERWGESGNFLLPFEDFERLIHEDGEVCAAVEKRA